MKNKKNMWIMYFIAIVIVAFLVIIYVYTINNNEKEDVIKEISPTNIKISDNSEKSDENNF